MSVEQHTALGDILHSSGEHVALDVATGVGELLGAHAVVHAHDILLDDGTLIEVAGDKVGGRADNLHTAVIGLVVGLGALEGRQEAVVDVDDTSRHGLAQLRRQDLHIAGQNNQVNLVFLNQLQDTSLLLGLGGGSDGKVHEGDVIGGGQGGEIGVVGDDQRDFNVKLAGGLTEEQVVQAVTNLGDHDHHAGLLGGGVDLKVHGEGLCGGLEGSAQLLEFGDLIGLGGRHKLHAHEEALRGQVAELGGIDDVQVVLDEEGRDGMDDARAIGAREGEDEAGGHDDVEIV